MDLFQKDLAFLNQEIEKRKKEIELLEDVIGKKREQKLEINSDNYESKSKIKLVKFEKKRYLKIVKEIKNYKSKIKNGFIIGFIISLCSILLPLGLVSLIGIILGVLYSFISYKVVSKKVRCKQKRIDGISIHDLNSKYFELENNLYMNDLYLEKLNKEIDNIAKKIIGLKEELSNLGQSYNIVCTFYEDALREVNKKDQAGDAENIINNNHAQILPKMTKKLFTPLNDKNV